MKLILRWILNAVALMLIPELVSSVKVDSYTAALISAVLLGCLAGQETRRAVVAADQALADQLVELRSGFFGGL